MEFRETLFTNVISRLITYQSDYIETIVAEAPSVGQPSTPTLQEDCPPANSPPADQPPSQQSLSGILYLNSIYPSHTASIAALLDNPVYQTAYQLCFRIQIYNWITNDLPEDSGVSLDEILDWLRVGCLKTLKNMSSRFNGAKRSLEWLRKQDQPLNEADSSTLRILSQLVDGNLTLLPSDHMGMETQMSADDMDAIGAALSMRSSALDHLVARIKRRMRPE
jgi:hypothetical protein